MAASVQTALNQVLAELKENGSEADREGKGRFGINVDKAFGVRMPAIRKIAKTIKRNHPLALALWKSGYHEARLLAGMIADPKQVDGVLMDCWTSEFDSWDVCDQMCMNLYHKMDVAYDKCREWSKREEEYVKRAGFALMAVLAVHDKKAADLRFLDLLPLIEAGSDDPRNFVKKAVNWALRQIGKRNAALNAAALHYADTILARKTKPGNWVARDAIRELTSEAVRTRLAMKKK